MSMIGHPTIDMRAREIRDRFLRLGYSHKKAERAAKEYQRRQRKNLQR